MNDSNEPTRSSSPVIIFGEALIDTFGSQRIPGGAPYNVACHLAALGLQPWLITRLGKDAGASQLHNQAARFGLETGGFQCDRHYPTGCVAIHEDSNGHHFEIDPQSAYDFINTSKALQQLPAYLHVAEPDPAPWLYFGTLALRNTHAREQFAQLRQTLRHRAFVDLNWRPGQIDPDQVLELLHNIDILKLNVNELAMLLHWLDLPNQYTTQRPELDQQRGEIGSLLRSTGAQRLIVTYGAAGTAIWNQRGSCLAVEAGVPTTTIDTVGAGDAIAAIWLAGLSRNWPEVATLQRGNRFAAAICAIRGATPEQLDFYLCWRQRWQFHQRPYPPGIVLRT